MVLRRYAPRLATLIPSSSDWRHYPREWTNGLRRATDCYVTVGQRTALPDQILVRPVQTSGRRRPVSTCTPGPIVDDTVILRRYRPLADAGFARCSSSSTARKFSSSAAGSKLALPSGTCTLP